MDKITSLLNAKAEIVSLIAQNKATLTAKEWAEKTPEERLLIALNGALALIEHAISITQTGDTQNKVVKPKEEAQFIPLCKREVINCTCNKEARPYDTDEFACCLCKYSRMLINAAREQGKPCVVSDGRWGALINWLNRMLGGDAKRHLFFWRVFGVSSSIALHECEKGALLKVSGITKEGDGWVTTATFAAEMQRITETAWLDAMLGASDTPSRSEQAQGDSETA